MLVEKVLMALKEDRAHMVQQAVAQAIASVHHAQPTSTPAGAAAPAGSDDVAKIRMDSAMIKLKVDMAAMRADVGGLRSEVSAMRKRIDQGFAGVEVDPHVTQPGTNYTNL